MREPDRYRQELELLNEKYPGCAILTVTQVAEYIGRSRRWCREKLEIGADGMSKCKLALWLARL